MSNNYTYAVARIRALESKMVSPAQVTRMIESPDLDRAFFVLNETSYSEHISSAIKPFDYEEILKAEQIFINNFLKVQVGGNKDLKILFRLYDYGNAKILIRYAKKKEDPDKEILSSYGTVDRDDLTNYIIQGEGLIPEWLETAINKAVLAFEEDKMPASIDMVLDKIYLENLKDSDSYLLKQLAILWNASEYPLNIEGDNKTIEFLKREKMHAFGIDPIIAFWLAKAFERRKIRHILVGKKHRINKDLIKKWVRESYV